MSRRNEKKLTPEQSTWYAMRTRCFNPNMHGYNRYGGRGITICERWLTFENFLEDMGPRPGLEYSIDRIDNNGNYEPGNCRWVTQDVQHKNKTHRQPLPKIVIPDDSRPLLTVRQVALCLDVAERTVREMIDRGDIPAAKIGKAYRIERVDLENFIASRKEAKDA